MPAISPSVVSVRERRKPSIGASLTHELSH
jgi:hypothetical protein